MNVEIKHVDEQRVAAVRHRGPYNQINEAFEKLGNLAGPAGLFDDPAVQMVGLYYDDPETTSRRTASLGCRPRRKQVDDDPERT